MKKVSFIAALFVLLLCAGAGLHAESPYPPAAPWPAMRADMQNTGTLPPGAYEKVGGSAEAPVHFHTDNGIFSTPVIDAKERVYIGSADHYFYALDPHKGKVLWMYDSNEIIDSAAALSKDGRVYFPAGDAKLHAMNTDGEELWAFDVLNNRPARLHSFSTNYWWEANVVLGPDGSLYAGNDDFYFYRISPEGQMEWAFRTGFLIWAAGSFDHLLDTVYIAGFDMKLYAVDRETGKKRWKTNLKNALVASPAVGPDGTIYQGSFDGNLYAISPARGRIKWSVPTGGHIYASAAVAPDGRVYVASTDGFLYSIESGTGRVDWKFYTGDAIRCSPVVGPDPEGDSPYLVYFGGGEGSVYAIDPAGKRRWSYDTLVKAGQADYPNINASPALGKTGLVVASASGDIVWVPYDYYQKPGAEGITTDPTDGFHSDGPSWHLVSSGGRINREPLPSSGDGVEFSVHPNKVINMRLISRKGGRTVAAKINPSSISVSLEPSFKMRAALQSDDKTIHIIPEQQLDPGKKYKVTVTASFTNEDGTKGSATGVINLAVEKTKRANPILATNAGPYEITHMAVPQPAIIPSLDQIGIASLTIPFTVVKNNGDGTFVAWAVQRFGEDEQGEPVGVPDQRTLFYAFSGETDGDFFQLEARNSFFEGTSFPFPLDLFRMSGRALSDGTVERGASLFAEWEPQGILKGLTLLSISTEEESAGRENWFAGAMSGGGIYFWPAAAKTVPTVLGFIKNKIWKPWGIYNHENRFVGSGTFRMRPLPEGKARSPYTIKVDSFEYLPKKGEVRAVVSVSPDDGYKRQVVVGILLVDNMTGEPVRINYNTATVRQRTEFGKKLAILEIPRDIEYKAGGTTAYLMVDLTPVATLDI